METDRERERGRQIDSEGGPQISLSVREVCLPLLPLSLSASLLSLSLSLSLSLPASLFSRSLSFSVYLSVSLANKYTKTLMSYYKTLMPY